MDKGTESYFHKYVDDNFKKGVIKVIILNKIKRQKTYPYELFKALCRSHFWMAREVNKSDVYNILNALEKKGLVRSESRLAGSRVQKRYSITPEGARVADESRRIFTRHLIEMKKLISYEFK